MQLVRNAFTTRSRDRTPRRSLLLCFACLSLLASLPLLARSQTNIKTKINPKDGAAMVYIPPGEFIMGSSEEDITTLVRLHKEYKRKWFADEEPQHRLRLNGYWIYKYEVTVGQYRLFCSATRRKMPPEPLWEWKDDHPIVNVSWNDAKAYCDWAGVRLPTEAEWEKAARGTTGSRYPWGNEWEASKCVTSINNRRTGTRPVGSYPHGASPFGVLDMAGNVWEWCADWYDRYPGSTMQSDDFGIKYRVIRGGAWVKYKEAYFRTASRNSCRPNEEHASQGFRCVQSTK